MDRKTLYVALALTAIMAVAVFFRFYDIQNYPPGLFPDQAANGEDALLILEGDARPFYPRGNGREALFFYLQAGLINLYGIGVWPMFAASAIVGTLTVLALYFATRVWFGRLSGLLAAFFLATSHWHTTLSRTGFRAILIPLFVLLFTAWVGFTIQAVKKKQVGRAYLYAALAGAAWSAGWYSYIAYRIMIAVVAAVVLLLLLAALHSKIGFPHFRRYGTQLLVGILAVIVVAIPLAGYFWQHPQDFVGRAGQVSIFSRDLQREYGGGTLLGTLAYSTRETFFGLFAGSGDSNWRHSVPGFPLLNPIVGVLALLGLAWALHGAVTVALSLMRGEEVHLGMIYVYLLLLFFGMAAPVVTTAEGMPHGLRSIGLIPPLFILAGTAGSVVLYWLKQRVKNQHAVALVWGAAAAVLTLTGFYGGVLYFVIARNDSAAHAAYRADLTPISAYLKEYRAQHPDDARPYVVLDKFSLQTVHFLTAVIPHEHTVGDEEHPDEAQHLWQQVDPATSHLLPLTDGEIIVFTQSTLPDADRFLQHHPKVEVVDSRVNRFGQEYMRVYRP